VARVRLLVAVLLGALLAGSAVALVSNRSAVDAPASADAVGSSAAALQNDFVSVYRRVAPSVVQIQTSEGLGSGIVFDNQGNIVTNAHVVGTATKFTVTTSSGAQLTGALVGLFRADDLAVIKVPATKKLRPATFANSSKVRVGDIAMAIGNPLGLSSSVTQGIVSALHRTASEGSGVTLPDTIQTSAPINPGNSGGALVDIRGRVIGIPTLAAEDPQLGGAAVGIGFAIPSNVVVDIAGQIVKNGKVVNSHRAYLGVSIGDTGSGVYVGSVTAGGPAAQAGLRVGDVIVAVNGKPTASSDDLGSVLATLRPGQSVKVKVTRQDGTTATLTVKLGEYPGGA
jgi:putative serine protease PepD